mmetsp:Transcript_25315/g.58819  ORF Transcript_25315/g.58819 Transcript_25315/m.58819 type:complete len:547 (+) Transcript_25315:158-1798(+)
MEARPAGRDLRAGSPAMDKRSIDELKEYYLQRLAKNPHGVPLRNSLSPLGPRPTVDSIGSSRRPSTDALRGPFMRPQSSISEVRTTANVDQDIDDIEVMCNNCCTLIKASEAPFHDCVGGRATAVAGGCTAKEESRPIDGLSQLDLKLRRLRESLEKKLQESMGQVNVMRHLTQLRYHIDTALKWQGGNTELGMLCGHTLQQLKQLTAMARVFDPSMYIFSKRIESVVSQKERELRKTAAPEPGAPAGQQTRRFSSRSPIRSPKGLLSMSGFSLDKSCGSIACSRSPSMGVGELSSDCGTMQVAETVLTQDHMGSGDVGNLTEANDFLSFSGEDDRRRWFYSQCLTVKLGIEDKAKAKRILISDLYSKVRADNVAPENWPSWIREEIEREVHGGCSKETSVKGKGLEAESTTARPPADLHIESDSGGTGAPPAKAFSPTSQQCVSPCSSTGGPGTLRHVPLRASVPAPKQNFKPNLATIPQTSRVPMALEKSLQPGNKGSFEVTASRSTVPPPKVVWTPRTVRAPVAPQLGQSQPLPRPAAKFAAA